MLIRHSSTSNIIRFSLKHATSGIGLTGLAFDSAGLIISTICNNEASAAIYTQAGATIEAISSIGTYAAPTASKCRFKEVDATNHPGVYEFQFADSRFSIADARTLIISVTGAANLLDADYEIELLTSMLSASATSNLEDTYDGTGYTDDNAPATQAQIGRLTSGTAAINTTVESFAKSGSEPETLTYLATIPLDGVYHIVEDDGGDTDCYYQFDVGGNGIPVSISWHGYAQPQGKSYAIYAYKYATSTYEQIGTVMAVAGTTPVERTFSLTNSHIGTGADIGKVRFRILSSDGTAFATDRILCSYSVVTKSAGYSNGSIFVNTNISNENTEAYVDGTADNPVSTWTAAKALSLSLGIKQFNIANGSSVVMDADCSDYTIIGAEYALALGGQLFENAHVEGANVSGIGTSGSGFAHFVDCNIGDIAIGKSIFDGCNYGDSTITMSDAAIYTARSGCCVGAICPTFDFGAAVGSTVLKLRAWQGSVEIANLGQNGTDVFAASGNGTAIIASTCIGGTINISGNNTITDNVVGGFSGTINEDARVDVGQINAQCDIALNDYGANKTTPPSVIEIGASLNDITVAEIISGIVDGSYDLQEMMRIIFAACAGKSTGGGTATLNFRDSADAKNRISATVDANGNRSAITLDAL